MSWAVEPEVIVKHVREQVGDQAAEEWVTLEQLIETRARDEGRAEGRAEGARRLLSRLLEVKFGAAPAWLAGRLAGASLADLEGWAERAVAAEALDDVLGAPAPDAPA